MDIIENIVIIVICCVALGLGATWLVDSAARIARRLGVSGLVIGLTIVAFGTSAPEFAVSITGALAGNPDISVGNIVGSNIFNIGFILGGCAAIRALKVDKGLVWRDGMLLIVITVGLLAVLYDKTLSRNEGVGMFLILMGYLFFLFWKREAVIEEEIPQEPATWKDIPLLLVGFVLIIGGGYFMVYSASAIARSFGLSEWVISVTIVAAGTSVPEFVISLVAILKKHHGISAGNLIGSNIFNTLGVLGLAGALHPLRVDSSAIISTIALVGLTVLVVIFLRTGWLLKRWEGFILLLISLAIWGFIIFRFHSPPA